MPRPKLLALLYFVAGALAFTAVSIRLAREGAVSLPGVAAGLTMVALGAAAWRRHAHGGTR